MTCYRIWSSNDLTNLWQSHTTLPRLMERKLPCLAVNRRILQNKQGGEVSGGGDWPQRTLFSCHLCSTFRIKWPLWGGVSPMSFRTSSMTGQTLGQIKHTKQSTETKSQTHLIISLSRYNRIKTFQVTKVLLVISYLPFNSDFKRVWRNSYD